MIFTEPTTTQFILIHLFAVLFYRPLRDLLSDIKSADMQSLTQVRQQVQNFWTRMGARNVRELPDIDLLDHVLSMAEKLVQDIPQVVHDSAGKLGWAGIYFVFKTAVCLTFCLLPIPTTLVGHLRQLCNRY